MTLFLIAYTAQGLMNHFKRLVLQDPDFQAQVVDKVARRFEANQVNIKSIVLYFFMAHDAASIFGAHQRNPRWGSWSGLQSIAHKQLRHTHSTIPVRQ